MDSRRLYFEAQTQKNYEIGSYGLRPLFQDFGPEIKIRFHLDCNNLPRKEVQASLTLFFRAVARKIRRHRAVNLKLRVGFRAQGSGQLESLLRL